MFIIALLLTALVASEEAVNTETETIIPPAAPFNPEKNTSTNVPESRVSFSWVILLTLLVDALYFKLNPKLLDALIPKVTVTVTAPPNPEPTQANQAN